MPGNVTLKINGDPSGLLAAVKTAMAQIEQEAKKLKIGAPGFAGGGPLGAAPGVNTFQRTQQEARAQVDKNRNDQVAMAAAITYLREKERLLNSSVKLENNLSKQGKDTTFQLEAQKKYLEQIIVLKKQLSNMGFDGSGSIIKTSTGQGSGTIDMFSGASKLSAIVSAGASAVYGAGNIAENIRKSFAEAAYRGKETASQAYNMAGAPGQRISSAFAGTGLQEIMFGGEIGSAQANAGKEMEGRLRSPFASIMRPRQSLLSAFGTDEQKERIKQELKLESSQETASQLEAIKNGPQGKILTESKNKFLTDWRRNLDFQRQMGLSEGGFRGFLGGVNGAGFSDELGMGSASAILGAGGSSRAATGNAAFALQMGRQFDLTNAGQAIGSISGQMGGAGQSKDALIAIQAEGTRIGLNRSDMREENRKFVEMAAGVINQSNVSSGAGVDQLMEMFARSMTGATTVTGLEAGKSAYEAYQRQSNIQSGPSAVMRAAGMRGDKVLGRLNERDRATLSMMPESEITTDSNEIQAMAAKYGVSAEDIVKNYHGVIGRSLFVNPTTDAAIARFREAQKKYKPGSKEFIAAQGEAVGEIRLEGAGAGMTEKQLTQYANMQAAGDYSGMAKLQEEAKKQAESGQTTRPGDEAEKQQAQFSRMANEMFTTLIDSIAPAAKETAIFAGNINALVAAMKGGIPSEIAAAQKNLFNSNQPQDQTQVGTGGRGTAKDFWHP